MPEVDETVEWKITSNVGNYVWRIFEGECGYSGECPEHVAIVDHPLTALAVIENIELKSAKTNRRKPKLELHFNEPHQEDRIVTGNAGTFYIEQEWVRNGKYVGGRSVTG